MLKQTDVERERYEARRKAQLDYNSEMKAARMEGEKIGIIHSFERMLKRPETPTEQLLARSFDELDRMAEELHASLLKK